MTAHVPSPSVIELAETRSTNTYLSTHPDLDLLPDGTCVIAHTQSAGRGQRGNSWESEPGLNVTMSILLRPKVITPRQQFYISEIVSLAIVNTLNRLLAEAAVEAKAEIKWPNDIYIGAKKICGILIEHSLSAARIGHTIAGIGLNVNQTRFVSDAPNPVSLTSITGHRYDIAELSRELTTEIMSKLLQYETTMNFPDLHRNYLSCLWRRDVCAGYFDTTTQSEFRAKIEDVEPDGMLTLRDSDGTTRRYAFKEVAFII